MKSLFIKLSIILLCPIFVNCATMVDYRFPLTIIYCDGNENTSLDTVEIFVTIPDRPLHTLKDTAKQTNNSGCYSAKFDIKWGEKITPFSKKQNIYVEAVIKRDSTVLSHKLVDIDNLEFLDRTYAIRLYRDWNSGESTWPVTPTCPSR